MTRLIHGALAMLALGLLLSTAALAGDCGCKTKCGSKGKCGCMQQCGCKSNKCDCASRSYCKCKSQCRNCWGGSGKWADANACCPPSADVVKVCSCGGDCGCAGQGHPYERVFNGSSMLCDTGCNAYIPCKRVGLTCTTKCEARAGSCGCNKCKVDYCVTQECQEIERPRVVPWWFSGGKGNLYLEASDPGPAMVDDWAGGSRIAGAAGSPEPSDERPALVEAG